MQTKNLNRTNLYLLRIISCVSIFSILSFNNVPVKKSKTERGTSTFQLYSASINFQNRAVTPPSGYEKDYGKGFGSSTISAIGKTFSYGWKSVATQAPLDISEDDSKNGTGVGRNRLGSKYTSATTVEKLEGTFIHMQGNNIANWQDEPRGQEVYWELEVPNGYLEVTLSFGDKGSYTDSRHTATVEGYSIIAAFKPDPQETRKVTMLVEVEDGALTLTSTGAYNSKINYIEVEEIFHDEDSANRMLGFNPQSKNLSLITGVNQGTISTQLTGEGATAVGLVIDNDMIMQGGELLNTNSWISLPDKPALGALNFKVNSTGIRIGETRNSSIIATAAGFKPATFDASLVVVAGCPPLSILPCDQLVNNFPVNITFDGNQNGLADADGVPIGLTTAMPHIAPRLKADLPLSYPTVNGYEPAKIIIKDGNLNLTASKGIASLAENRQVNTLGVALQNPDTPFQMETRLLDLRMPATGNAQAGLTFGSNEDLFVKLVVLNGNTIQLKKEINGTSASGLNNADNITVENLDLLAKDVMLRLVFDRENKTVSAFYSLNEGELIPLSAKGKTTLELPGALMTGLTSPSALTGVNLASIFASYNNAPSTFDTTFDYFTIEDATATLSTPQMNRSLTEFKVYPNPVKDILYITGSQQEQQVNTISIYDLQGRLINDYDAHLLKTASGYQISTGDLSAGVYVIRLKNNTGDSKQLKFIKSN